ncbi:MAG TPA: ADP-forming succinate--CoA ligase subunit beta [Longilinea sp.]|nr:ADP-forming succinate--CoA ligase subunit beta [Longilinea sp.]
MRLQEYQSKQIFSRYHIPIPRGRVANTASEVKQISEELGGRVVVKAQVLVGGRGKAGGIRLAKTAAEAEAIANQILGMEIKGLSVHRLLIDEAVGIVKEIYLAVANDRSIRRPVLIASASGGMDIEDVAANNPELIIRIPIDPLLGLRDYHARDLAVSIDLPKEHWKTFNEIAKGLWTVFEENDAGLAEINPLVITTDGRLLALDGKMIVDDNALYRHPELAEMRDMDTESRVEVEARKYNLSFIPLQGDIGCLVNGAGLAMATMDIIKHYGGEPANFLDIGGGASAEKVASAVRIILADKNVKVVLVNIFGGITRCDEVAKGLITATQEHAEHIPMVVRLVGTNAAEGKALLEAHAHHSAQTLSEAAELAVKIAKGGAK